MKIMGTIVSVLLLAGMGFSQMAARDIPPFPSSLNNAKFVYVTSYDGSAYSSNPLPEDRESIAAVQSAVQQWGKYILVYQPEKADMIIAVQSRPNEDVLAVYQPRFSRTQYLWREMSPGGLAKGETPLVNDLHTAIMKETPAK